MEDILVFNVDTGTLPLNKADAYINQVRKNITKDNQKCLFFSKPAGTTGTSVSMLPLTHGRMLVFNVDTTNMSRTAVNKQLEKVKTQVSDLGGIDMDECMFLSSSEGRGTDVSVIPSDENYLVQTIGAN